MTFNFSLIFSLAVSLFLCLTLQSNLADAAAIQNEQVGYGAEAPAGRVPILYEAYYPEPREWRKPRLIFPQSQPSRRSSLQEIERLRELTSQLLREEEQLEQLEQLEAAGGSENVLEPRSQMLRYVFSGEPLRHQPLEAPAPAPLIQPVAGPVPGSLITAAAGEPSQLASLTISDVGPPHKVRHHHGQANWLLRRLAASAA